jgi:hypothetical protein
MWVAQAFGGGGTSLVRGSGQLGARPASSDAQRHDLTAHGNDRHRVREFGVIVTIRLCFTCVLSTLNQL